MDTFNTADRDQLAEYDAAYRAAMGDAANMAQIYVDAFPSFKDWCASKVDSCDYCGVFGIVYGGEKSCARCMSLPLTTH